MGFLATLAHKWSSRDGAPGHSTHPRDQLFRDQLRIAGRQARIIFDVGAQHGQNALQYHRDFPQAHIFAFEPAPENLVRTRAEIAGRQDRIEILGLALGDRVGEVELNLNSHDGTHSRLPIGDLRYWAAPATPVGKMSVPATTIDAFMDERGLRDIDIVSMDIQGGELAALRGAQRALESGRIGLIAVEVTFKPVYRDIPLFWEIGGFLSRYDYNLFALYDCVHAPTNDKVLSWADALFIGPRHQQLA
jgi:FkbM family methyltransferase